MLHPPAIFLGPRSDLLMGMAYYPLLSRSAPALAAAANIAPAERFSGFFLRRLLLPSAAGVHVEHPDVATGQQLQRVLDLFGLVKLGRAHRPETLEPGRENEI